MPGMKNMFFNLILVSSMAVCQSHSPETGVQLRSVPQNLQPERRCSSAGQICATCESVSICVTNIDGTIMTINQTCHTDEKCINGECVKGAFCNYRPFQCSDQGFFPDPYDCTKYHVCLPLAMHEMEEPMTFQCLEGKAYDALSASCSFLTNSEACVNRPIPECTKRLQVGVVPSNPNLYYTCVEKDGTIAPELWKCHGTSRFNVETMSCQGDKSHKAGTRSKKLHNFRKR
ncbi:uncharacterized protein [Halyomorpha halys]|uniref:uncharacterized protein n=1 Tax=Halyomorpha halys TaxID=286706 RepID=UPI0034D2A8B4